MIDYKKMSGIQKELVLAQWQLKFAEINRLSIEEAEQVCDKYISLRKVFERIENE